MANDDEAQTAAAVRDWPAAKLLFQHCLEIEPNNETKLTFASVLMNGEGDFAAARALLATIPYPPRDAPVDPFDFGPRWELSMLEGDFDGAEKVIADLGLDELPPPFNGVISFLRACTAWARGDERTAREFFLKSKSGLESLLPELGDDNAQLISVHGLMYAYLGEKELAVRESQRAVNLVPETDAIERPQYLANLALVYAITGEKDKAVALVEKLLTTPMVGGGGIQPVTLTQLRGWRWASLRSDPRFLKIIEGPEPKTVY